MWSNRKFHSLLVGVQNGTGILEDSLTVSMKLNIFSPYNPTKDLRLSFLCCDNREAPLASLLESWPYSLCLCYCSFICLFCSFCFVLPIKKKHLASLVVFWERVRVVDRILWNWLSSPFLIYTKRFFQCCT